MGRDRSRERQRDRSSSRDRGRDRDRDRSVSRGRDRRGKDRSPSSSDGEYDRRKRDDDRDRRDRGGSRDDDRDRGRGKDKDKGKPSKSSDKFEKKLYETREEKMLRRLEKKKRKREQEEASKTICGYTDENNRFGDGNLTQAFVWAKKKEKDGNDAEYEERMGEKERRRLEMERRAKIEEEVEKVKRRREEREKEAAWMEEEKARMSVSALLNISIRGNPCFYIGKFRTHEIPRVATHIVGEQHRKSFHLRYFRDVCFFVFFMHAAHFLTCMRRGSLRSNSMTSGRKRQTSSTLSRREGARKSELQRAGNSRYDQHKHHARSLAHSIHAPTLPTCHILKWKKTT
jgi:hypothetical protein